MSARAFGGHDRLEIGQIAGQGGDVGAGAFSQGSDGHADRKGDGKAEGVDPLGARPLALRRLLWEIEKRTSIEVAPEAAPVRLSDAAELYSHPMLYWTGDRAFAMPSDEDLSRLRRHLVMGGMLILDSAEGRAGGGFDQSVRALTARLFPNRPLARLSEDHVLYRSFYLLRVPAGRVIAQPYLEAVVIGGNATTGTGTEGENERGTGRERGKDADKGGSGERDYRGRAVIVYSQNDLGGAWARDRFGQWLHEVVPGGEAQREHAFRLGVNLVMYALCLDYKADQVHVPFIMRRRMWQAPLPKINLESPTASPSAP